MMMPANYSVIAENEMTYVNGGAFIDCLAPVMNDKNWQNFNSNLIYLIGNSFMTNFVKGTLGQIFDGSYVFGDVLTGIGNKLTGVYESNGKGFYGVLNAGLQVVGGLAAIYTLGSGTIGINVKPTFDVA